MSFAEAVEKTINLGGQKLKENLLIFVEVLVRPKPLFISLPLESKEEFVRSSVFAVFSSLVNVVLFTPSYSGLGIDSTTSKYLLSDTLLTYSGWFLFGLRAGHRFLSLLEQLAGVRRQLGPVLRYLQEHLFRRHDRTGELSPWI